MLVVTLNRSVWVLIRANSPRIITDPHCHRLSDKQELAFHRQRRHLRYIKCYIMNKENMGWWFDKFIWYGSCRFVAHRKQKKGSRFQRSLMSLLVQYLAGCNERGSHGFHPSILGEKTLCHQTRLIRRKERRRGATCGETRVRVRVAFRRVSRV